MNGFQTLRTDIKACHTPCTFNWMHSHPLYFDCNEPEKVTILVITEQPKERKNLDNYIEVTEKLIICDLFDQSKADSNSTRNTLVRLLGPKFAESARDGRGPFYWTHHTKCPSYGRETRPECMAKWFNRELDVFRDLRLIVSFGTEAYKSIDRQFNMNTDFYDCFWDEIRYFLLNTPQLKRLREIEYIALPHPSKVNPLSNLMKFIEPHLHKKIEDLLSRV